MSNATPDTRGAGGERRRRRSRGGKGRNRNRQQDAQGGEQREHRERRQPHGQNQQPRHDRQDRQDRGPRPSSFRPKEPVKKLTLWQKILKAIGLYKEPVRPPRPEREERKPRLNIQETPPVKANTRVARQGGERGERITTESAGPSRRTPEKTEVGSPRIYLGNLSYDASEEDLKDLFKGIGTVRRVEIVYNRRTHKSKGYGFVDMLNVEEAKRSVEVLHDQFFMGRKLVVSGAKTKEYEEEQREEQQYREEQRQQAAEARAQAAAVAAAAPPVLAETAPVQAVAEETPVAGIAPEAPAAIAEEAPAAPVEEAPAPVVHHEEEVAKQEPPL